MSFIHNSRTLKSGTKCYQKNHLNISVNAENATNASDLYDADKIRTKKDPISTGHFKERITANVEAVNEQILTLNQSLNRLTQDNFGKTNPSVDSRTHRLRIGPSLDRETGISRASLNNPGNFFFLA